jgi:hypothetical protein
MQLNLFILRIFLVIILFIGIFMAVFVPYYLHYAEPYFAPSVINGINIFEYGHLINSSAMKLAHSRLAWDLNMEESYPAPGMLTAILIAVTKLPYEQVAYIPIAGIASLLYFALAKYVIPDKHPGYAALFAVTYFGFNLSDRLSALTTGRSTLGTIVLILFTIGFLRLLDSPGNKIFPWLVICIIATVMAGKTYYTATLAIIVVIIISSIATHNRFRFVSKGNLPRGFSILIIAILLFLLPPVLATVAPHVSMQQFFKNIMEAIFAKIGQESSESNNLYGILFQPYFTNQLRLWGLRIILLSSLIAIVYIVFTGIRNPEKRITRQWLYTIVAIGVCSSELPYMLKISALRVRFLLSYGFLCVLCVVYQLNKTPRKIFSFAIVALAAIVTFSNLSFSVQQGGDAAAKPFATNKVQPVADYIHHIPTGSIAADAGYTTNLWLSLANEKKNSDVNVLPIWRDALLLKQAQEGSAIPLIDILRQRNIEYLLLNTDNMPFFGDVWGYSVRLHRGEWMDTLPLSFVYDDGRFILCRDTDLI